MRTFLWCAVALVGMSLVAATSRTGRICVSLLLMAAVPAAMIYFIVRADRAKEAQRKAALERAEAQRAQQKREHEEAVAAAQRKVDEARANAQTFLREVHEKYQQALLALEAKPTDMELRKAALVAGRTYAEVARRLSGQSGRTMFDEAEIQNDIAIRIGNSQVVAAPKRPHKCPNCAASLVPESKVCRFCDAPVHA